jgi:hypothetical protein
MQDAAQERCDLIEAALPGDARAFGGRVALRPSV